MDRKTRVSPADLQPKKIELPLPSSPTHKNKRFPAPIRPDELRPEPRSDDDGESFRIS